MTPFLEGAGSSRDGLPWPDSAEVWRSLLDGLWRRADDALYRAKEAGRARTEVDEAPDA